MSIQVSYEGKEGENKLLAEAEFGHIDELTDALLKVEEKANTELTAMIPPQA